MIDHEATRAAARALYEGQSRYHFTDLSDEALTAMIRNAHERPTLWLESVPILPRRRPFIPPEPESPEPEVLDAGQIETVLRSVPQICHHCRLPSNAETTVCPSPRGHWFVTDYTAMAEKLRARLR
jgi:hypothetical protein